MKRVAAKGLLWLRSGSHMGVKRVQFDYLSPHWDITAASSSAPDMTSANPSAPLSQPMLRAGRRREDERISGCAAVILTDRIQRSGHAPFIPSALPASARASRTRAAHAARVRATTGGGSHAASGACSRLDEMRPGWRNLVPSAWRSGAKPTRLNRCILPCLLSNAFDKGFSLYEGFAVWQCA